MGDRFSRLLRRVRFLDQQLPPRLGRLRQSWRRVALIGLPATGVTRMILIYAIGSVCFMLFVCRVEEMWLL